ncbi:unnamed protein product [Lota lota]
MSDSDSAQVAPLNPPPKRRRIIFDPSTINSVPIYSNKVNNCLQLKPTPAVLTHNSSCDHAEAAPCSDSARSVAEVNDLSFTDSEEEEEHKPPYHTKNSESVALCSPSPPLTPSSPCVQASTRVWRDVAEVNSRLGSVSSLLSLPPEGVGGMRTRGRGAPSPAAAGPSLTDAQYYDDDILLVTPSARGQDDLIIQTPVPLSPPLEPEDPLVGREIQLKFRCRTEIHRVPVVSSRPLGEAVEALAVKLKVPPARILLLRNETELPAHSSANQLGLSIADIIDCVVMAEDAKQETQSSDIITVRLQGKDRGSTQEYSLHKEASLGSILSQYTASRSAGGQAKLHFLFDGSKIKANHTPAQLEMEDGDVIEVWS